MQMLNLLPAHGKAAVKISEMIAALPVGTRLPPERELSEKLGFSRITIRKAILALRESGVIESRQGSGTYVSGHLEQQGGSAMLLAGILVPTVEWPAISRIVSGAEAAASENDYRLILVHDHGRPNAQLEQLRQMSNEGLNGFLVFLDAGNVSRPDYIKQIKTMAEEGRNIILLDRYLSGVELPCVMTDVNRGMYELTQHLIMSGRRKLAVLSWGDEAGSAERDRMAGFRRALEEYGLSPEPVLHGTVGYAGSEEENVRRIIDGWLAQYSEKLPFDALVCFVDTMAFHAFMALGAAGIRVPQDVALTGFDDNFPDLYHAHGLDLTTVEQPLEQIGREAMKMLLKTPADRNERVLRHKLLPPRLIVRTSCGSSLMR